MADAVDRLVKADFVILSRLDNGSLNARRIVTGREQDTKVELKYEGGRGTVTTWVAPKGTNRWTKVDAARTGPHLKEAIASALVEVSVARLR